MESAGSDVSLRRGSGYDSAKVGGFKLDLEYIDAGAEYFLEQGVDITEEAMDKVKQADAILLGAMGLQDVRLPNGTEIAPHLKIRTELGLFAG